MRNSNNNNCEFVVRKFRTHMFKCALQLKCIKKKNERYTLEVKITA